MRHRKRLALLALTVMASAARGDILPEPDRGPPMGSAGGLDFVVEWAEVAWQPLNGPHYTKRQQVVVLSGCVEGHPNCQMARARNLIGMEVRTVDDASLQPEKGMVRQILDAFARGSRGRTVILELVSRNSNAEPVKVSFAKP